MVATEAALSLRYIDVLRQAGFHCLTVQTEAQVVGVLTRYRPSLVVVDISAYGDEATSIVKYIRLRCPDAHFVGVTRNPRSWDTNTSVILGLDGLHSSWPDRDRLLRLCDKILCERERRGR